MLFFDILAGATLSSVNQISTAGCTPAKILLEVASIPNSSGELLIYTMNSKEYAELSSHFLEEGRGQ